jgi:hypothetical protein
MISEDNRSYLPDLVRFRGSVCPRLEVDDLWNPETGENAMASARIAFSESQTNQYRAQVGESNALIRFPVQ